VRNTKGKTKLPKASQANIMTMKVSKTTGEDTTLIIPFAFYFNERPVGVEYTLFVADTTDTIWVGEIWKEKGSDIIEILSFIYCFLERRLEIYLTCGLCIWSRGFLWPLCVFCVVIITYCALTSFVSFV
jgi:hypothetical protein